MQELRIAEGAFAGCNLLAVDTELVVHLFQQTASGILTDSDSQGGELFGDHGRLLLELRLELIGTHNRPTFEEARLMASPNC